MKKPAAQLESLFQALGDRTRLRLLNLIADGEVCVCFFVEVLGEPQPKISRHLGVLRAADLVAARRDGKWMHYRLTMPNELAPVFENVLATLRTDPEMNRDRAALARACCSTRVPELLKRAPKPQIGATAPN
ncbi:MAG TPA: metalloregulator ArsR/SmtB family transcription factor [Thermoanaerobaculia bacterium]|jgi:ArsR family transcriptional regulator|nr:metalloregulator ArsR/SmtB family transcription factor [Thermoanaerobaculia bacterium]